MFDVTNRDSYDQLPLWHTEIVQACPSAIGVLVGNKVDMEHREVCAADITYHRDHNLPYYDLSVRSYYNFEKPLLHLARQFFNDPELQFAADQ